MRKYSKNWRQNVESSNKNVLISTETKKQINELYEKEFNKIFSDILIITKKDFFETILSNIKNSLIIKNKEEIFKTQEFLSLIKSNQTKYEQKYEQNLIVINTFLENYKKSINNQNSNNYITNFTKHCLQTDYYARHKCPNNNFLGYFVPISLLDSENKKNISGNNFKKNEENLNNIKYVICMSCKKIYLSNKFLNYCSNCETNYLSQISNFNEKQSLLPIVWNDNHCELKLNEKVICSKCNSQMYIDIKTNIVKCLKFKTHNSQKNIERTCNICKSKFKPNILIYNSLERNALNNIINEALSLKIKAYPKNSHSCKNKNNEFIDYFHSSNCSGKIYIHKYNNEDVIICEKCRRIFYYNKFIWTCPYCKETFQENKNVVNSNITGIEKDSDSMKKNYSTSIFRRYRNIIKKYKDEKLKNKDFGLNKICEEKKEENKPIEIDDKIKTNDKTINNNGQINFFKFTIKERERSPIRIIKSKDKFLTNQTDKNDTQKIDKDKNINQFENKKDEDNNKENIPKSFFRRYKNNNIKVLTINKKNEKTEMKSKNINDNITIFNTEKNNQTFDQFNRNYLINKKNEKNDGIQLTVNSADNTEKLISEINLKRKSNLNESHKNSNDMEKHKTSKNESDTQKNKINQINLFPKKETNSNYSHIFQIKNYLIKKTGENNEDQKNANNIEIRKAPIKNEPVKNKRISENKYLVTSINKEQINKANNDSKNSKRIQNKIIVNTQVQPKSNSVPFYDTFKSSNKTPIQKDNNSNITNNNNSKYSNNINFSSTNGNIKQRIRNYRLPYRQKTENEKEEERVKFSPTPKKPININKPKDIIEAKDIDSHKDFSIDDPYLNSHPDSYEEIQETLKEIMYKVKLPMFNPDFYKIEKKIGEGTHGSIFQVLNTKNGKRYALKKIFSNDIVLLKYIKKEFDLVYDADHPNILGIYAIYMKCFDSNTFSLSVLMDLGETDWEIEINEHYHQRKYYTENELMAIMKQLVSGLVYLQRDKKIAHRDVKPENVIVFKNKVYNLGDFGEAKGTKKAEKLSTLRGTDTYMSPILYNGLKMAKEDVIHDLYKSDVFSLGYSMLYAVSLTHDIINEIRDLEKMEDITKVLYKRMKPRYSDDFINIILKMINPDEKQRIDFIALDKLVNHPK